MSKKSLLTLEPKNELTFTDPGNEARTVSLTLKNDSDQVTYFKIKVTAPKRYCVRPNQGEIKPNSTEMVEITLTSLKPEELAKCKDKFLVQSIHGEPGLQTDSLFKSASKEALGEAKLLCKFVYTDGAKSGAGESIVQQNQRLKHENANLSRENDSNKFGGSNMATATVQRSAGNENTYPLPVVIIAFLLGIILGYYVMPK